MKTLWACQERDEVIITVDICDSLLRRHSNDLGTNLVVNHWQLCIVICQLLIDKAGVEVVARTLEVISTHNTTVCLFFIGGSMYKILLR